MRRNKSCFLLSTIFVFRNTQTKSLKSILVCPNTNSFTSNVGSINNYISIIHKVVTSFFEVTSCIFANHVVQFVCHNEPGHTCRKTLCWRTGSRGRSPYGGLLFIYIEILNLRFNITSNISLNNNKSSSFASIGMINFAIFPDSKGIDCVI